MSEHSQTRFVTPVDEIAHESGAISDRLLHGDEGSIRARTLVGMGLGITATCLVVGVTGTVVAGVAGFNYRLKQNAGYEKLSVEAIDISSVQLDLNSSTVYAVEGRIDTKMRLLDKINVPGTGNGAQFVNVGEPQKMADGTMSDPRSKVLIFSGSGKLNSNPDAGTVTTKVITENGVEKQIITFPIGPENSALISNAQFPEADARIEKVNASHELTMFLEGITGVAGAPIQAACHLSTLGKKPDICQKLDPQKLLGLLENDAVIQQRLRFDTLEAVQKQCAPLQWKLEQKAIIQSIVAASVDKGWKEENVFVEFVGDDNKPTTAPPDYTRSAIDDLKARGVLLSAPSGADIIMKASGVKCQAPKDGALQP
ncbi:MAG TPA: hypothetical protein VF575_00975 [Candidatus Saccharimonadales bacterium]|jgi:hypothetical protein